MDWVPAVSTTGLLTVGLWLCRNLILTRWVRSVSHEFDQKIEGLKSELRAGEERLKADLRAKESEIAVLRSGALSALANRQASLDKRRLEAVDQIWSSVRTLGPGRQASRILSRLKYEAIAEEYGRNDGIREFLEIMGSTFDPKTMDIGSGEQARPFVHPMVWAYYEAMVAVCAHAVIRYQTLKSGLGKKDFADTESVTKLLKIALPHQTKFIDEYGASAFYFLLEELEASLLREIDRMLNGGDTDKATVALAAEILAASNKVMHDLDGASEPV